MSVVKLHLNKSFGKLSVVIGFHRNYATLDTVDMAYTAYGKDSALKKLSSPLIVMHCLFGSKRTWNTVCKSLHEKSFPRLRVIAVDARNHGDSPHANNHSYPHLAEDVMAFIKKHGIKKPSLLGHSMGGRTAMYFALKYVIGILIEFSKIYILNWSLGYSSTTDAHEWIYGNLVNLFTYPDSINKLIVGDISPIARPEKMEPLREIAEAIKRVKLPQNMSLTKAREFVNTQLNEIIESKSEREFILTNLTENANQSYKWLVNAASLAINMDHVIGFPDVTNLKFNGPVLFLLGENSNFVEKIDYPLILKLFPKAEFYEISNAGHWLYNDNPQDFIQKCISFLNKK